MLLSSSGRRTSKPIAMRIAPRIPHGAIANDGSDAQLMFDANSLGEGLGVLAIELKARIIPPAVTIMHNPASTSENTPAQTSNRDLPSCVRTGVGVLGS